jgi:cysteinyl-tRNA synthetase
MSFCISPSISIYKMIFRIIFSLLIILSISLLIQCSIREDNEIISLNEFVYWAYNIQDVDAEKQRGHLVGSHFDLCVLEPVVTITGEENFNIAKLIKDIKQHNLQTRSVEPVIIAYVDIGQAEAWRWYREENWGLGNPSWIAGTDPDEWEDCFPVAYWDAAWEEITIYGYKGMSHMQSILKAGFDGIYMDWVEAYNDESVMDIARRNGIDPVKSMFAL